MLQRTAQGLVRAALQRQAAVALIGPRQVGKTTLAHRIAEGTNGAALYLDLKARQDRDKLSEPALFLREMVQVLREATKKP